MRVDYPDQAEMQTRFILPGTPFRWLHTYILNGPVYGYVAR
jgi:hypothetical protein